MDDFQESVPRIALRKGSQISIKSVIATILFFIFVVLVCLCLVAFRKVEKVFDKQTFYIVYVAKNKRKIDPATTDLVKKLGGAGSVLFFKEEFYLVANVYLKESDAKEIVGGLLENFSNAGVLKIEHKSIEKKKVTHIAHNLTFSRFFEKLFEFNEKFEELQMSYLIGELSESGFLTEVLKNKLEFEQIVKDFENQSGEKLFDDIKSHANMCVNYFNEFFEEFLRSTKKETLICKLKFDLVKLKYDMFENLQ